ncbi:MAG TPA: hypothetical protein VFI47_26810 [Acidimicrobiales bacterium]|nr:hypothetical protein [Acidimicrobiales bacterium]
MDEIYRELARLRSEGTALLIVEQQVAHGPHLRDRVAMLDRGTVTWKGRASEASDRMVEFLLPGDAAA